jgi:hypothetical protein
MLFPQLLRANHRARSVLVSGRRPTHFDAGGALAFLRFGRFSRQKSSTDCCACGATPNDGEKDWFKAVSISVIGGLLGELCDFFSFFFCDG